MANPWFAFYGRDYCAKTARLNLTEHGAYLCLILEYYNTATPLPANAEILLTVCRAFADHEKAAVMNVLDKFFVLDGDVYRNPRIDEELQKASQLSEKRRDAGKKGADVTNSKSRDFAAAKKRQLPTQPQPQEVEKFYLPNWIPKEAWDNYEVMRRRIRKPMTDRARELAVQKLKLLSEEGSDPELVLNQSVLNSWQGLFPVKGSSSNGNQNNQPSYISQRVDSVVRKLQDPEEAHGGISAPKLV